MRSRVALIISVVILCVAGFILYRSISDKQIDDYVTDKLPGYDYEIDELDFYADDSNDAEVIDVSNVINMLGLDEAVVMQTYIDVEGECDLHYDYITLATSDIDTDRPIFYAVDGEDMYYVFYDTSENIRGIHFDSDMNIVRMI